MDNEKYYIVYPHIGELVTCTRLSDVECNCIMIDKYGHSHSANLENYSDTPIEAFRQAEKAQAGRVDTYQQKANSEFRKLKKILFGIDNLKQEAESK